MEVEENLYDDFSFLPTSEDYNFEELDEILRSTESQLDSSIDLSALHVPNSCFDIQMQSSQQDNEFSIHLNTDSSSALVTTNANSPSTSSPSPTKLVEDDHFNPDDFINFLNDDDIKMEELSPAVSVQDGSSNHRETPSPTGSCNSSTGSVTSGIQSDASSVSSSQSFTSNELFNSTQVLSTDPDSQRTPVSQEPQKQSPAQQQQHQHQHKATVPTPKATTPAVLPITLPLMSLQSSNGTAAGSTPARTLFQAPSHVQATNFNVLQGTLIPVKTVPLTSVTSIKTPIPIKIEPKLEPKLAPKTTSATGPVNLTATAVTAKTSSASVPVLNSKPKTIYLSSNDFKALMQKLKTNGKHGKINNSPINGQMPKIVMKTTNGQLINAGKAAATQLVSKSVLKSATPLIIQQQPSKSIVMTKAGVCSRPTVEGSSTAKAPDINIYKGIVDEKTMKKQQRMIKNRESASLSRKKKKEYVVSLESRINDLEKENISLKGENSSLRSQLVAFAQTCQCKHGNISDFILNSLNISSKRDVITCINEQQQHVRIAPKPTAQKSIKQRMLSASVKKNVAVLFAMAFMVTLNIGGFQSYIKRDAIENAGMESAAEESAVATSGAIVRSVAGARRGLLWAETESEFNGVKLNRSRREIELEVPPLHFLRPHPKANEQTGKATDTIASPSDGVKCPVGSNLTETQRLAENQRLASNLHKWIGGNDYLNLSTATYAKFSGNRVDFNFKPDYFELKTYDLPLERPPGYAATSSGQQKRKHHYLQHTELHDDESSSSHGKFRKRTDTGNSLDFYKPKISEEYVRLFKGIKRQADTFYVLSFNMDHILLPASAYNKSSRPKMSLLLPTGDPNLNGDIVLMRIDCEVVNTTEVQLKSDMIPEKLRPTKFATNGNDVANNETRTPNAHVPNKRPREDMNDGVGGAANATLTNSSYVARNIHELGTITKPHLTQRTARSQNESVVDKTKDLDLQVPRNATLFQRMRKTIEYMP